MNDERRTLNFDWVQTTAGALTAVSSAVLLSTVGVAGTLIGAAVGSVLATVGNAIYAHYLALSKDRVASAKALAATRVQRASTNLAQARVTAEVGGARGEHELDQAQAELRDARTDADSADEQVKVSWREALAGLPWKRIAPVAAGVFVLAMGAILTFELVTGRAVATYTGGADKDQARTSIPGVGRTAPDTGEQDPDGSGIGDGTSPGADGAPADQPAQQATGGTQQQDPGDSGPSAGSTDVPEGSAEPTPTPTPSSGASATPTPTPTVPTPTPTPVAPTPTSTTVP